MPARTAAQLPDPRNSGSPTARSSRNLRRDGLRPPLRRSLTAAATAALLTSAGLPALGADTPAPLTWKFDLGTPTSPVAEGHTRIDERNRYSAGAGFGLTAGDGVTLASRDRGAPDALGQDFVLAPAFGFALDVPAGTYDVTVWTGDTLAGTSTTRTNIALEGVAAGSLSTRQAVTSGTFRTTVADGQLTVDFTGTAAGYVNGISVTQVPATTDPEPEPEPEPEEPVSSIAAPQSVRMADVAPGSVDLRWNEVAGATGYAVLRSETVGGTYTEVARTGAREVFATDTVDTRVPHYYRVRTITADGQSAPSAAAVSTLAGDGVPGPALPAGGVLSFDLGSGAVAPGAIRLDATSAWSPTQRYGFVDVAQVTATDRGTPDPLRADFVSVGDTELVVDLPDGDYTVSLVAGDATEASEISLVAEQITKVQTTAKAAGQFLEMSFDIALVDGQLNLEVGGTAPKLNSLVITAKAEREAGQRPTVWVTGDSTVQSYTADFQPQAGWGQMIDRYLSDDVVVDNRAIGGRSSKNFISQGRLDEVLRQIRPGDYLFAQFGHNDASYGVDDRFAAPADYANYLRAFVEGARQRGATPVLVTPVSRRSFDATTGKFNVSFPEYVRAATALATETGTPLVDLSASSRAYLDEIGPEAAKSVFLHVPAGVYPGRPTGTVDDTHFQEYGAIQMARLVATDVAELDVPLAAAVEAAEPPAQVPAAPTGVVASGVSSSSAQLTWTAVEGADIYKVLRKEASAGDDAYALVTSSTLPQASVTGMAQGASYDLRVVAVNGRGDSQPSAAVRVTTKAPLHQFDLQPAGSALEPGYTEVNPTTAYSADRGYGFTTVTGLNSRDRGINFTPVPTSLQRDFLLPGPSNIFVIDVANGSYAVKATWGDAIGTAALTFAAEGREYGRSTTGRNNYAEKLVQPVQVPDGTLDLKVEGWINGLEITPLLLAPTELAAGDVAIDGTQVQVPLTWSGTADAVGYRVYRQGSSAAAPEKLGDTEATTFVDTTADVGLTYTYTVVGLDAAGTESIPSNALEVTTIDPDVAVAPVPAGVALGAVNKNDVTVTWQPSEGALFYQVFRADPEPDGTTGEPRLVGRTDGPTFTDTTVLTTVEYVYSVAAVNAGGVSARSASVTSPAVTTLQRQAERLDRSPVAVATDDGIYVGWRLLGQDPQSVGFHVYRDGVRVTSTPVTRSTNLLDEAGDEDSTYRLSTVVDGIERWAGGEFEVWDSQTLDIPLDKPADALTKDGQPYTYRANDASIGDVDGDGQYEIVLKWDPSNSRDNSQAGYTGNVYVDAYELDGTRLWRIDLGANIRAGAHYTQFQVFDYDGNGTAEVVMKTADGTVDGTGTVIGDARADYRNSTGYVLTGPEYLTVFNGATGAATDTVPYTPARGSVSSWGDAYGNRVDRFLAGTAYLDGERPSVLVARGYYTRMVVAAYDFDGTDLTRRWVFDTEDAGEQYEHQGNHSLAVADVDGDQKDEILYGSLTLDDDGEVLYNTGLGHGDAQHVSDFDPRRPGMEVFSAHEDMRSSGNRGATYRDAATGELLWSIPATKDTGRAAMADVDPRHAGAEGWAIGGDAAWNSPVGQMRSASGELLSETIPAANFLTWWDGDLLREIGDHDYDAATGAGVPTIAKWDWEAQKSDVIYRAEGTLTSNSTKGNPALQADLLGDWREELVTRTADSTALRISTTVDVTEHRLRTLVSDPAYRLAVAWQNTGYNQPPHTSYFIGEGMATPGAPSIVLTGTDPGPGERVPGPATAKPGPAQIAHDNHEDVDTAFTVTVTVPKGQNAQTVTLLRDGQEIARQDVVDATPGEQTTRFVLTDQPVGQPRYTAVLTNQHGSTTTRPLVVVVR